VPGVAWALSVVVHAAALGLALTALRASGPTEPPAAEFARGEPLRLIRVTFVPMPPPRRAAPKAAPPKAPDLEPPTPTPPTPDLPIREGPPSALPIEPRLPAPPEPRRPDINASDALLRPAPLPPNARNDPLLAPAPPAAKSAEESDEAAINAGIRTGAELVDLPAPEYPPRSRRLGEEGLVLLEVEVLANGRAGTVRVARAPPYPRLVDAAVKAVRKAKFKPATSEGVPVRSLVEIPVRFQLN
jgi:protein TonB